MFAIGIGSEVKPEYLQEIIKIGSEDGTVQLFPQQVNVRDEIVERVIRLSIQEVYTLKKVLLKCGPREEEVKVKLTS